VGDLSWGYLKDVKLWMAPYIADGKVRFISQGASLAGIARHLYGLSDAVPITPLLNPVDMDMSYELNCPPKQDLVIILGRVEAQKRVWIFCEIAKRMPQYRFVVLGATGKGRDEEGNRRSLAQYRDAEGRSIVSNLSFEGHVDGERKASFLKQARVLVNCSFWEGIPVSWIEALSYGVVLVSAFDRDAIAERFGTFIGEVSGDGTDDATLTRFCEAIEYWMMNPAIRNEVASRGIDYVRERHTVEVFTAAMRRAIRDSVS
jgi:glycosyltransferase involved in cell wall biosynthesis